ncbi:serine hydrolase domain-containing protein [Phenylobacterium sp.]|uniref:serine hydrolase domain-containing protein n=1 Tax=Phenylobacterium sp. TaxID=1871053 RepID=UPI0025E15AAF|nr:serine hydrolase domain-containing protein [Phenylobacterium sp.]MCA6285348.1 beta-lactamase family protein [Phenylobacterium sp.]MCA6310237.1 beta-lactamase family protein [Phenylobacterium sp.]MCA6324903.1 beta-lactamase family protein [Phenylobacterium sp.]MCA6338476.1 beta-lactamase family protein [Phenylobacterium sp.]MCA6340584.1 beta-lactamase family protein [Phenylobacterium sp.]
MSTDVHGSCDPRFESLRRTFAGNLESGADVGASFAVTIDGEMVVDLWGGWADPGQTRPWEKDTLVNVYSTTKTMTALTALLLADRGELDFHAPVARYWPEFAANGKSAVTVAHLMSHSSGLSGWKEPLAVEDLYDWEKATALLAAQAPFWEPGTAPGYHGMTQGYLVGEVVRRITGKTLGTVFREEIAEPLGADFHIGLPASEDHRVAELIPPPPGQGMAEGDDLPELTDNMSNNPRVEVAVTQTRAWRGAEIPAAGGHGNARAIARVHAILANGGEVDGRRYLSEAGCRRALELQVEGQDLVMHIPARFGLGFGLAGPSLPAPNPNTIFWGGYGGSLAIIDMDARTSFGYAMNRMAPTTTGDMRGFGLIMEVWMA